MQGFNPFVNNSKLSFACNLLCLAALIATASLGWMAGHVIRFSIPEYQFQHPPTPEIDPQIKNGFEFEGIRRLVVLPGNPQVPQARVFIGGIQVKPLEGCVGNTYYTSLPAKCRSVDGRLVRVGRNPQEIFIVPFSEWEK